MGSTARAALNAGMTTLARAVAPAFGPAGRVVAVQREMAPSNKPPEMLTDGAAIARRLWAVPDRWENMGLLLARHMAVKVEEAVGDAGTSAILLAQALVEAGQKLVAAGHDPMQLRRGLERALPVALAAIEQTATPLRNQDHILKLAQAMIGRDDLAALVQECFDVVGPHGVIEVRPSQSVAHDREYIQGVMWNEGWKSSHFVTSGGAAVLQQPYVLCASHRLTTATQLAPVMSRLIEKNASDKQQRGLVVIAIAVEGDALNILVTNKTRGVLPSLAIHAPGAGNDRLEILQDLATVCGGRLFAEEAGDAIESATLADLGQAESVQAIRSAFTMTGGKGRPAAIRQRIQEVRKLLQAAQTGAERDLLAERAGKLLGGVALLRVGGATEAERMMLMARAEEAVRVVRVGMEGGVVAGGGAAYLVAIPALSTLTLPDDQAPAVALLQKALQAPMAALARNSGHDAAPILQTALAHGPGAGFDVRTSSVTDMFAANIVDPLRATTTALRAAVSCAAMTLTTEALISRPRTVRDEDSSLNP